MKDYIALTKPRITWLILMSTGVGYFFGARAGWQWLTLLHTVIGTGLIASGTAALNQWYEREADAKMKRTQGRPLPSGRLSSGKALVFAIVISAAGFAELFLGANALTAWLGLFTLLSYLFVYTPLKQRSPHSTTIGAIPGAMPPLIGYAAASGTLTLGRLDPLRDSVLLAVPAFLRHRLDVSRGLRARRHPHAARGGTGWRIHGAADSVVFADSDSDQPGSEISLDGGKSCTWPVR